MGILKNLFTAIRGGTNELGEAIVKSQNLRILGQKLREAETELKKGERGLAEVMAEKEKSQREAITIQDKIKEYGKLIKICHEKREPELGREIAEKIAYLEPQLESCQQQIKNLAVAEKSLKEKRKEASNKIDEVKRQVSLIRSQDSMNRALKKASEIIGNKTPNTGELNSLLGEIQVRQQYEEDRLAAEKKLQAENTGQILEEKLIAAGMLPSKKLAIEQILTRYQN